MENKIYEINGAEMIDELWSRFVMTRKRGLHFIIPSVFI